MPENLKTRVLRSCRPPTGVSRPSGAKSREEVPKKLETKREPKPKLLSPDIFWWGGGLPREGVGAKKFDMWLETRAIKFFWWDIPGFCRDIPEVPGKFEKTNLCSNFGP